MNKKQRTLTSAHETITVEGGAAALAEKRHAKDFALWKAATEVLCRLRFIVHALSVVLLVLDAGVTKDSRGAM